MHSEMTVTCDRDKEGVQYTAKVLVFLNRLYNETANHYLHVPKTLESLSQWGDGCAHFISVEGRNANDQLEGLQKTYDGGWLKSEVLYVAGQKHGVSKTYGYEGCSETEITYENGVKNGPCKIYCGHFDTKNGFGLSTTDWAGKLWFEGSYKNNERDGVWKQYSYYRKNGYGEHIPVLSNSTSYKNDQKNGPCKTYFTDLNLEGRLVVKSEGEYKNNQKNGTWKAYDSKGHLTSITSYKDGIKHGLQELYHKNGHLKFKQFFNEDEKDGVWEEYNASGQMIARLRYDKHNPNDFNGSLQPDKLHGEWKIYNSEGVLLSKTFYKNGKAHGVCETYKHGKLSETGMYKDGEKDGQWLSYFKNGKLHADESFKNGKRHGTSTFYLNDDATDNRKVSLIATYENGIQHGLWKAYARYGDTPHTEGIYQNGKKHGIWKVSSEQEQLIHQAYWIGSYDNDKKAGIWKRYEGGILMIKESFDAQQNPTVIYKHENKIEQMNHELMTQNSHIIFDNLGFE